MKFQWILGVLSTVVAVTAAPPVSDFLSMPTLRLDNRATGPAIRPLPESGGVCDTQPRPESRFYNSVTEGFYVNGTTLPEVNFDVGESYAGNLPISNKPGESDELFFWFFPTTNKEHQDDKEIVIWLNGGPGCSSLMGFVQENGPFSWQPGTLKPTPNPFSWHLLTNVVWIDQPVGTGFAKGKPSIEDEDQLAEQFTGFWHNFVDTFGLHGWKVYITGESYAGMYGPYISSHFIDANDTEYHNLQGLLIYDGIFFDETVHSHIPVVPYIDRYQDIFAFTEGDLSTFRAVSEDCGYIDYFDKYLTFPPSGKQPVTLPGANNGNCTQLWDNVIAKASEANPCFNFYNIIDHCPLPYSSIFNPLNSYDGNGSYFNIPGVKNAIHAPDGIEWTPCAKSHGFSGPPNKSPFSGLKQLPHVIDTTQNVILAQGGFDGMVMLNGVILGIQNMTWGGEMGFQYRPQDPFYVPDCGYRFNGTNFTVSEYGTNMPVGYGVLGTAHHERGLTLVVTKLAGHQGPEYAPSGSFRHLEKLLGRVKSLSGTEPFTLPDIRNVTQPPEETLGRGTVSIF